MSARAGVPPRQWLSADELGQSSFPASDPPATWTWDVAPREPDPWVDALSGTGQRREDALGRLHELLLRAARFEVARSGRDNDDLAMQAADDALLAILKKLHTFRGDSRFTSWAYKFAVLEARGKVHRRAWRGREIALDSDSWAQLADGRASPEADLETVELLSAVSRAIGDVLSDRQRMVLTAITLDDVPIEVLADRLSTTRGALYKVVHDSRKKLRARLADQGFALG